MTAESVLGLSREHQLASHQRPSQLSPRPRLLLGLIAAPNPLEENPAVLLGDIQQSHWGPQGYRSPCVSSVYPPFALFGRRSDGSRNKCLPLGFAMAASF